MFWRKRNKRSSADFSSEIEAHLQDETARLQEQGLAEAEARAAARRSFGNLLHAEERFYESHRWLWWDHIARDIRYAARMLAKTPGFTAVALLMLALGIGANTAIFSMVNALLLRTLPYPHAERLGVLYARTTGLDLADEPRNVDGEQWEQLRDNVPSLLPAVSSMRANGVNFRADGKVQYLHAGRVSAHYFDVFGVQPLLGRNFLEVEDRPHGPATAILSYALWRNTADPSVIGHTMLLKGEPYTIVGVLPENATTPLNADVCTPLQASPQGEGVGTNFRPFFRLRDGATWQQADAEMNRAWEHTQRIENFRKENPGSQRTFYSVPLQRGQTAVLRPQVLGLLLSSGVIFLIACANLAGLTLVRMSRRKAEFATRLALGASRWQTQRQLWTETLLLGLAGGITGIVTGSLALRGLLLLLPERFLPVSSLPLDARVLGFTVFLSLLTTVLCGILPAFATSDLDLRSSLATRSSGLSPGSLRLRQLLIAGEVALTVVLLAGAGLLVRTLIHLEALPPGFNPSGVLTAKASLDDVTYHDAAKFRTLLNESVANMRAIPGVQNAAMGLTLPYERAVLTGVTITEGKEAGRQITANEVYVTPGYFETLQIPLLEGRTFTDADGPSAPRVVIVNESFARSFFHGIDPIGHHQDGDTVVVGVVRDTVTSSAAGLHTGAAPLTKEEVIYLPAAQMDGAFLSLVHSFFQPSWIVRTAAPIEGLPAEMQQAVETVDPNLPFSGFYSMSDLMASTLAMQRIEVALLIAMAALALLLSAVGIFALVASLVAQRTREIGIRMALGSTVQAAMTQVGSAGVRAAGFGLAAGLVLCLGTLRLMRSLLYGVGVYDLPTILAVVAVLATVVLVAVVVPTLRIARIDPATTLREE